MNATPMQRTANDCRIWSEARGAFERFATSQKINPIGISASHNWGCSNVKIASRDRAKSSRNELRFGVS
jgi:hypothetical protein